MDDYVVIIQDGSAAYTSTRQEFLDEWGHIQEKSRGIECFWFESQEEALHKQNSINEYPCGCEKCAP